MRGVLIVSLIAFAGGAAYGIAFHRDHAFPYKIIYSALAPKDSAGPTNAAVYNERLAVFKTFPVKADVVMIGDSLIQLADWNRMFPDERIANYGINGDTTAGLLARVEELAKLDYRSTFVLVGINDFFKRQSVDDIFTRYTRIIERLKMPRILSVVYTDRTHRPVNADIAKLNVRLRAYCDSTSHCQFVDLNAALAPNGFLEATYTVDGVHLSAAGYAKVHDAIKALLPQNPAD